MHIPANGNDKGLRKLRKEDFLMGMSKLHLLFVPCITVSSLQCSIVILFFCFSYCSIVFHCFISSYEGHCIQFQRVKAFVYNLFHVSLNHHYNVLLLYCSSPSSLNHHRPNRLRFVYTHFKSCDQSLDKTPFGFSNILHAMQSCAMNTRSRIILKLPKSMVT